MLKHSILISSLLLANSLVANTVIVENGWKLYGAPYNIDVAKLKKACDFKNLWTFKNDEWINLNDKSVIYELDGFWIKGDSDCGYSLSDEVSVKYFKNRLLNDGESAIKDATVSLNGIEAEAKTDEYGNFLVSGIDEKSCQLLTVNTLGYEPVEMYIDVTKEEITSCDKERKKGQITLTPLQAPETLNVTYPTDNLSISATCTNPKLKVTGIVSLEDKKSFIKDIMLVIDVSESTGKFVSFDLDSDGVNDTVLDAELYSANKLLEEMSDMDNRVGIVKFSRYREKGETVDGEISTGEILTERTRVVKGLTTDFTALEEAITTIKTEGSSHGTDIARGIRLAIEQLNSAEPRTIGENGEEFNPSKHIILLTDGRPTLPYEPVGAIKDPNESDRQETLTSAYEAKDSSVAISPIIVQPENRKNRTLTAVPAIQAITGMSGEVAKVEIENLDELPEIISKLPLDEVAFIKIENLTLNESITAKPQTTGEFEIEIALQVGENNLTVTAHNGIESIASTINLIVNVSDEATLLFADLNLGESVSNLTELPSPYESIKTTNWYEPLLTLMKDNYPNAKSLIEIEDFILKTGDLREVEVEYIYKDAGYKSDLLYFTYDSNNPPTKRDDVYNIIKDSDTRLFYLGDNKHFDSDENATLTMLDDSHDAVGFIVTPNYRYSGKKKDLDKAIFTLHNLNAGGYKQFYPLYDESIDKVLLAIEDITLVNSDGDYNDALITIPASLFKPKMPEAICD